MTKSRRINSHAEPEVEKLRGLVQAFVRSFGLLVSNQTPCGHAVSVSHAHALVALQEQRTKTVVQTDLGNALGIDKSNVARLCSKMEAAGHVVQTRAPGDGRVRVVELTAEGARLARQIERASAARYRKILGHFDARRRSALFDSLANLNVAVTALRDPKDEP